jgi:hypothetical protein
MKKNSFWFMASIMIFAGHAFNGVGSDSTVAEQKWKEEIIQLNQEFLARQEKNKNYQLQLKASHYRNSIYGAIGGIVAGHCSGLLIDKALGLSDSGYAIPLTVITPFVCFCAVQIYYIGLSHLDSVVMRCWPIKRYI